ncbi:MAG: SDR family oxidoreductase [Candidatus Moranbacteria bacterium]|nr:SDR family oxidoreductase [Candidatus Moranbacteria bacterium]
MDKKILILGADGMAGNMIKTFLEEKEYDVYATTRKETMEKNSFFDVLGDFKELEVIIDRIEPNFVINCIGVLNQFAEDNKSGAVLINSFLPHYIDSLSEKYQFKFVHISTDCVFSGEKGDYGETDFADATSFYGKTKSLGEVNNERSVTFRTSIVGPDVNEKGLGLFNWFMQQKGETKGFSKVIWTGVTTLELAKAIEKSFDWNVTGLYHLVNNEKINKYDLLNLFKKYMSKDIVIKEDSAYVSNKSLINSRTDFDFQIPTYETMIEEMSEWIDNHEEKYKQIILNKHI